MLIPSYSWYGIGTEIGVALGICVVAREEALRKQREYNDGLPEGRPRRTDKWTHAYVGCALRRGGISPGVASMMAWGKEGLDWFEDVFFGDADSTPEDAEATMNGYWNAYEGATIRKRNIGCGIVTYEYVNVPSCERTCDLLYDINPIVGIIIFPPDWMVPPDFGDGFIPMVRENQEIVIKTAAIQVAKFDLDRANQISENRKIESETTQKAIDMTNKLRKINKSVSRQRAMQLKENGERGVYIVQYLLNKNKKEIHDLKRITPLCNLPLIKKEHALYIRNKKYALRAMTQGYDGCKHCMAKFHKK